MAGGSGESGACALVRVGWVCSTARGSVTHQCKWGWEVGGV